MHLLFLDESGQQDKGDHFALGGIVVRDADWPELKDIWHETLAAAPWPLDREVKWHGIRKGEVPPALADALFAALSRAPITVYVTLLDLELGHEREPGFFATPEEVYSTGLMFLAERFHHLLEAVDDVGLIVVHSRYREEAALPSPNIRRTARRTCSCRGSWRGCSSDRATTRSGCSAPTSSSR